MFSTYNRQTANPCEAISARFALRILDDLCRLCDADARCLKDTCINHTAVDCGEYGQRIWRIAGNNFHNRVLTGLDPTLRF